MKDQLVDATDILKLLTVENRKLVSRILGIDMCLKGIVLMYILDGGDFSEKLRKASVLKDLLSSLENGLEDESFMDEINKKEFFSSSNGIKSAIDDLIKKLETLKSEK